jgi:hypothetical protein
MAVRLSAIKLAALAAAVLVIVTAPGRFVRPAIGQPAHAAESASSQAMAEQQPQLLLMQTQEEADRKSAGCRSCHTKTDSQTMHTSPAVRLGCTDCHGGNSDIRVSNGLSAQSPEYITARNQAHLQPRVLSNKLDGALPVRAYTAWLRENPDYIRFINPGDLRIAAATCSDQHDVAWRHAMGSCLVQQRWFSPEESAFRRKLLHEWRAAALDELPAAYG